MDNSEPLVLTATDGKTITVDMNDLARRRVSNKENLEFYEKITKNLTPSSELMLREAATKKLAAMCEEKIVISDLEHASESKSVAKPLSLESTASRSPWSFKLSELPELNAFVPILERYPFQVLDTMKRLIDDESKNPCIKKYATTRAYEDFQKETASHLAFIQNLQKDKDVQRKMWDRLKPAVQYSFLGKIAEMRHSMFLLLICCKTEYLRRDESKGPFKINPPLDELQLKWLLESNPMVLFRTYQKWVLQKIVNFDYSDENKRYQEEAEEIKSLWKTCEMFLNVKTEWAELSREQQETIREFVSRVYWFIKYKHIEYAHPKSTKSKAKLRVGLEAIELEEDVQEQDPQRTSESESKREEVAVQSKSAKKREQKKRRDERRRNEEADGGQMPSSSEKSTGETGESVTRDAALSLSDSPESITIETAMVHDPMLTFLERLIKQRKKEGSGVVRDAFLNTLSEMRVQIVINSLDPASPTYRDDILHLAQQVKVLLQIANDIPKTDCREDGGHEGMESWPFQLSIRPRVADFIHLIATDPCSTMVKMRHMLEQENANPVMHRHVTARDYEEFQKALKPCNAGFLNPQFKPEMFNWDSLVPPARDIAYRQIAKVFYTWSLLLRRGKVKYLKSADLRGPFKIQNLPDVFQLRCILEDNPMTLYKTFEKWVKQKLIDHDYSDDSKMYMEHAEKCKKLRMECLKFSNDNMDWAHYNGKQKATIDEFVRTIHEFLNVHHLKHNPSEDEVKSKKKVRVKLEDIELDEVENQDARKSETKAKPVTETRPEEKKVVKDTRIQKDRSKDSKQELAPKSESVSNRPTSCVNEKYLKLKEQYLQERNNRTIAEGELKRNQWKMDEWERLKKEEEKWKQEKKTMAKKIRDLEEQNSSLTNQEAENKKLREDNEYLRARNERIESSYKTLKEQYAENKSTLDGTTRELNIFKESSRRIYMSMVDILHENKILNGPKTVRNTKPEIKLRELEEQRREFEPVKVMEGLTSLTEELKKTSSELENLMGTEKNRLEEAIELYTRTLDYNIRIIETTNSNIGLLPVPMVPAVSARFEAKLNEELEKLAPPEKTCPICFERKIQEGDRVYACPNGSDHVMCFKCGERWKSKNNVSRVMCTFGCPKEMLVGAWRCPF